MNYQVNLLKRVMISILISHNSPQQADVAGNKIIIIFFFCNKILQVTSVCCRVVMRNECRDHFSIKNIEVKTVTVQTFSFIINSRACLHFSR